MILSTCNRVEVYGVAEVPGEARARRSPTLCRHRGLAWRDARAAALHRHRRRGRAPRLPRRGEPRLDGGRRAADPRPGEGRLRAGPGARDRGPRPARAVQPGVQRRPSGCAPRPRSARHAVSVSFAAVELAQKIFGGLAGRAVLLVGAGKMGELAARAPGRAGGVPVYVANRTWSRAQDLARALGGRRRCRWRSSTPRWSRVDIVVTSTGGAASRSITATARQAVMHGAPRPAAVLHRHRGAARRRAGVDDARRRRTATTSTT